MSIFCSRGTPPRARGARAHAPVDVMNDNPLSQPTLSLSTAPKMTGFDLGSEEGSYFRLIDLCITQL